MPAMGVLSNPLLRLLQYAPAMELGEAVATNLVVDLGEGFLQPRNLGWNGIMPPNDTCYFYKHTQYNGDEMVLSLNGSSYREQQLHKTEYSYMNDRISSWICGNNVRVELCDDLLKHNCMNGHGVGGAAASNPDLGAYPYWGHGDKPSSIRLYAYDPVDGIGGVTVYDGRDCMLNSAYFAAGEIG
jgi:hypothetical protein